MTAQAGPDRPPGGDRRWGCALLAGGQGRRLGRVNKAELSYNGRTFGEILRAELETLGLPLYLSTASYAQTVPPGWTAVEDSVRDSNGSFIGPMGGIYTCLKQAERDGLAGLFFVPCDAPLFRADAIVKLGHFAAKGGGAVLWYTPDGRDQPVFAYYAVSVLPRLEAAVRRGHYRLREFLNEVSCRRVDARAMGVPETYFINVNDLDEYRGLP